MYYPYLRGRQFELIALREYAECRGDKNNIIPIIEPVKKTFNSMRIALPMLRANGVKFALILNPKVGEIDDSIDVYTELEDSLSVDLWIPAFIVDDDYIALKDKIEGLDFDTNNEVMIICSEQTDTNNEDFKDLVSLDKVSYVVSDDNRSLKSFVHSLGKSIIRLDDKFKGVKRNSDYLTMREEKFTEEHFYFVEDNYEGFSDYTPLVSDFIEGGGAPYAVAIHLTYIKTPEEIWVRHFTSVSNYDRANIQGKFAQAAVKAVTFLDEKDIHTNASEELRNYYNNSKYPGLGMSKKISIKHHLELVNNNCVNI
jgi:hypothetical protein